MTNAEKIVDGIIRNESAGMVCRIALKDETVAKAVSASIERYMYANTMTESAVTRTTKWLSEYLSFVSEKAPEPLSKPDSWAWYTVVCYASMFMHDKDWHELTEIGLPKLRLNSLPIEEDTAETEIEILKRCKEACNRSVEQRKKGSVH